MAKAKVKASKNGQMPLGKHIAKNWRLYMFLVIPIIYYLVFRYIPMFGNVIAFRKYRAGGGIFGVEWSGFKYFRQFIRDQMFWRAFANTLRLNIIYLLFRFPLTLIFALLLNEIKNIHWKKFVQTVSYLPHFISMVIIAGMIREMLSTNGPINGFLVAHGHEAISFMALPEWFTTIFVGSGLWQGLGWGTILYLAAIAGISPDLYEAAEIDGAGRFQKMWNITVPSLMPTFMVLLLMAIAGILNNGMDQYLVFENAYNTDTITVLDLYVYKLGINCGRVPLATVVGMFKSVISVVLLFGANKISKLVRGESII